MDEPCSLSVVVPLFNEEEGVGAFVDRLMKVLSLLPCTSEVILVDDGSRDFTYEKIKLLQTTYPSLLGIRFSRNFGHQAALLAGMENAKGAHIVTMDGDGQHPPELIPELMKTAHEGNDIVAGVRTGRQGSALKDLTSAAFYRVFNLFCEVPLAAGMADFRLISRRVRDHILSCKETDVFLRGVVAWVGFKQAQIPFEVGKRELGTSQYSLKKMLKFSFTGFTSFSVAPIRLAYMTLCGLSLSVAGLYSTYAVWMRIGNGTAVPGWTSLIILLSLYFSGLFILVGVIGEHVGKVYIETKQRPRFIISETSRAEGELP